jgi:hypothetical protein
MRAHFSPNLSRYEGMRVSSTLRIEGSGSYMQSMTVRFASIGEGYEGMRVADRRATAAWAELSYERMRVSPVENWTVRRNESECARPAQRVASAAETC